MQKDEVRKNIKRNIQEAPQEPPAILSIPGDTPQRYLSSQILQLKILTDTYLTSLSQAARTLQKLSESNSRY